MGTLSFTLLIPALGTATSGRAPRYVSPSTASVSVALQGQPTPLATINLSAGSAACSSVPSGTQCTASVAAPVGNDTFTVTTFDAPNGTGHQLSTSTLAATIVANATNTVALVLNGVVDHAGIILGTSSLTVGTPSSVSVTVVAYDAAGNVIVGPGPYSSPVTLADSDTSGATTLSTTSLVAAGTNVTLAYTGGSLPAGATITPTIGGHPGTTATLTATGYAFADFSLPASDPNYTDVMAPGPGDGNVWYATYGIIGKMSIHGQATEYTTANGVPLTNIYGLTAGPGGTMWFGDDSGDIGTISASGIVTFSNSFAPPVPGCGISGGKGGASYRRAKGLGSSACGSINWMVAGPDGNVWFSDGNAMIGRVDPSGNVAEWQITSLSGWPGGGSNPWQIAFAADGNLYVADGGGTIDRITVAGGAPTGVSAVTLPTNCASYALTIGPDGNVWFADACANVGTIAPSTFPNGLLMWSVAGVTENRTLYYLASSPGGVWGTDDDYAVYRLTGFAGVSASTSPAITPINPFGDAYSSPYAICIGPDGNVWVAEDEYTPVAFAKIAYGAPGTGPLSTVRGLPAAAHRTTTSGGSRGHLGHHATLRP